MLKAVIFDMDGVLVDSEPMHYDANVIMLRKLGVELEYEYYKQFIGSTNTYMWNCIREKFNLSHTGDELNALAEIEKRRIISEEGYIKVEGAAELVKNLHNAGIKLAVASSSAMKDIEEVTQYFGIRECFDSLVSGIDVGIPKPAPDIFLKAAESLGVLPSECVIIEDSCNGSTAAKAAGAACIGFVNPGSGNQDLSKADYLVESLANIDFSFVSMVYSHCFNEPWRVLETDRLILREQSIFDIPCLYELYDEPSITRYMEGLYPDYEKEKEYIELYIKNMYHFFGYGLWIVQIKETGEIIGRAGLENRIVNNVNEIEIGYMIGKNYQRKGYAYEACKAVLNYAKKELFIDKINAFILPDNKPSASLLLKLGFKYVGESKADEHDFIWYEYSIS